MSSYSSVSNQQCLHDKKKSISSYIVTIAILLAIALFTSACSDTKSVATTKVLIATTTFDNKSTPAGCDADTGTLSYKVGYAPAKSNNMVNPKTGKLCIVTPAHVFDVDNKTTVQLVSSNDPLLIKKCANGGIYVKIAKYNTTTQKASAPFHTNLICYGETNNGGENVGDGGTTPEQPDNPFVDLDPITPDIALKPATLSPAQGVKPEFTLNIPYNIFSVGSSMLVVNGKIHFLYGLKKATPNGGSNDAPISNAEYINTHYAYDIKTQRWTKLDGVTTGRVPSPRGIVATTSIRNKLYVYGGRTSIDRTNLYDYDDNNAGFYELNTDTNVWRMIRIMPQFGRNSANDFYHIGIGVTMTAVDNKIYMFGGAGSHNWTPNNNEIYVFDTDNESKGWEAITTTGDKPTPRYRHQAVRIGTKIYYYGGFNQFLSSWLTDPFYYFETADDSWHKIGNTPSKVRGMFSLLALDSTHLFISSGWGDDKNYIYNIKTGKTYPVIGLPATSAPKHYALTYYAYDNGTMYTLMSDNISDTGTAKELDHYKILISEPK